MLGAGRHPLHDVSSEGMLSSVPTVMVDTQERPRIIPVAHGKTDVGRQRNHNEDNFLVASHLDLFVVCDGMGGNNAGEVASALATTSIRNFYQATENGIIPGRLHREDEGLSEPARRLAVGVRKANADVHEISSTRLEHKGMGCTIVAVHVSRYSGTVQIAHVGDSRCYRIRKDEIQQLTRDHSLVGDALAWNPNLSEDELSKLPKNIISRALGLRRVVEVDVRSEVARPGDIYLLCSDGLTGMVKDHQILEVFQLSNDVEDACDSLIALANEGGGSDNITAVAVLIEADPSGATAGPEIMVKPLAVDDLLSYLDGDSEDGIPTSSNRPCEECGKMPASGDLFCGQCGARIAP